jgi:hypothetical protein
MADETEVEYYAKHGRLVDLIDQRIALCKGDIATELHEMNQTLHSFSGAFPVVDGGPDYTGHRSHHEGLIRAAKAQERFWDELRLDIAKKGAWGLLIILIGLVIFAIQVKLGLGGPLK